MKKNIKKLISWRQKKKKVSNIEKAIARTKKWEEKRLKAKARAKRKSTLLN